MHSWERLSRFPANRHPPEVNHPVASPERRLVPRLAPAFEAWGLGAMPVVCDHGRSPVDCLLPFLPPGGLTDWLHPAGRPADARRGEARRGNVCSEAMMDGRWTDGLGGDDDGLVAAAAARPPFVADPIALRRDLKRPGIQPARSIEGRQRLETEVNSSTDSSQQSNGQRWAALC